MACNRLSEKVLFMVNAGVVGCGYWGPNIIRNLCQINGFSLKKVCDLESEKLRKIKAAYPDVGVTKKFSEILEDRSIDAVVIATVPSTHFELAKAALEAGKHALVEKPLALSSRDAKELIAIAEKMGKVLMVGHTFEYAPAVIKLKEIIDSGALGRIYYTYSMRLNLGLYQRDTNIIWDLAPHDVSIMFFLLGRKAVSVQATAYRNASPNIEDVAFINVRMENNCFSNFHISWLDPVKVRKTVVVGDKKMAVYDDVEPVNKLMIFDKSARPQRKFGSFIDFQMSYRSGKVKTVGVEKKEPLNMELRHFLDCIRNGKKPKSGGSDGLRVVEVIEAAQESMEKNGAEVGING